MKIIKKLEKLFDKYYSKQLEIQDAQNPEYYLYMGKASAIGVALDLFKEEKETALEFGKYLTENEDVVNLIYKGKNIEFLFKEFQKNKYKKSINFHECSECNYTNDKCSCSCENES